jgi:hypothetical protein
MTKDRAINIELDPEVFTFKSDDFAAIADFTTPDEVLSERADLYDDILCRAYQPQIEAIEARARIKIDKARSEGKRQLLIKQCDEEIEALLVKRNAELNKYIWRETDKLVRSKHEQQRGRPSEKGKILDDLIREIRYLHEHGIKPTQEAVAERLRCTQRNIRERLRNYKVKWHELVRQCLEQKAEGK